MRKTGSTRHVPSKEEQAGPALLSCKTDGFGRAEEAGMPPWD
jgi:hypothetical protein